MTKMQKINLPEHVAKQNVQASVRPFASKNELMKMMKNANNVIVYFATCVNHDGWLCDFDSYATYDDALQNMNENEKMFLSISIDDEEFLLNQLH